jgi:hypothetical protein
MNDFALNYGLHCTTSLNTNILYVMVDFPFIHVNLKSLRNFRRLINTHNILNVVRSQAIEFHPINKTSFLVLHCLVVRRRCIGTVVRSIRFFTHCNLMCRAIKSVDDIRLDISASEQYMSISSRRRAPARSIDAIEQVEHTIVRDATCTYDSVREQGPCFIYITHDTRISSWRH